MQQSVHTMKQSGVPVWELGTMTKHRVAVATCAGLASGVAAGQIGRPLTAAAGWGAGCPREVPSAGIKTTVRQLMIGPPIPEIQQPQLVSDPLTTRQ